MLVINLLFEFARNRTMQLVAEVLDGRAIDVQHNGRTVVGQLALRLRIAVQ